MNTEACMTAKNTTEQGATCNQTAPVYVCTREQITHEELGTVWTYGILVQFGRDGTPLHYPDVSTDGELVRQLVERMNELELDPVHVEDVIEDFLVDFAL